MVSESDWVCDGDEVCCRNCQYIDKWEHTLIGDDSHWCNRKDQSTSGLSVCLDWRPGWFGGTVIIEKEEAV